MGNRIHIAERRLEINYISAHHSDIVAALKEYYGVFGNKIAFAQKFIGYSEKELNQKYKERIEELERTTSLTLFSFIEARFRIDYLIRCYKKDKDTLSRKFRAIYKKHKNYAALEDDIFENWKKRFPQLRMSISELTGAFKYRHWLAHGRYWEPKLGRKYDYPGIYNLAEQVLANFPLKN